MSNHHPRLRTSAGFTLIEMILVLFLIAVIAGLTTPFVMSTLDRMALQSSARKVASAVRYARSQAVAMKTPFVFQGDLSENSYQIIQLYGEDNIPKPLALESDVQIVEYVNEEETISDGTFEIRFYAQGNTSGGTLRLSAETSEDNDNGYTVTIDPITGKANILEEER